MRIAYLILLYTTYISFGQSNYFSQKSSVFEISEFIQGTWYLDKVEIIGLNSNDSSSIISEENRLKKIVFNSTTIESFPDTSEFRYYHPTNRIFNYQLHYDTITDWTEIQLISKRKKRLTERYIVVDCSFNNLVYEVYDIGVGLEKKVSRTRYHFVRQQDYANPFIGNWTLDEINSPVRAPLIDSIFTLTKINDSINSNVSVPRTEINFINETEYGYSFLQKLTGLYLTGGYALDYSRQKLLFIGNNIVVYSYLINLDGTITLTLDRELTSFYSE